MTKEKANTGSGPADEGAGADELASYMNGTGDERIRKWLQPDKHPDGRLKSGVCCIVLFHHHHHHHLDCCRTNP
jgi:hypothetical protein